jgi:hypothetical protein
MVSKNLSQSAGDRDPIVSLAHVEGVLQRAGWAAEDIEKELDGLDLPGRLSRITERLGHHGITRDRLMDRMGGSP